MEVPSPQSHTYVKLGHVPPQSTDAATFAVNVLAGTEIEKETGYDTGADECIPLAIGINCAKVKFGPGPLVWHCRQPAVTLNVAPA